MGCVATPGGDLVKLVVLQKLLKDRAILTISSRYGCVATPGGSLVKVAFVLTELSDRYLSHESQVPVQVASLPIRHHPVVRAVVSALSPQLPQFGGDDALCGDSRWTIRRCTALVQVYAPELDKRCRADLKPTNDSWRVDETYIEVKGEWKYIYRAVDSNGNTLDNMIERQKRCARSRTVFPPRPEGVS